HAAEGMPWSPAAYLSLVLLLQHVGGMQIEVGCCPLILPPELGVASIAYGDVPQTAVDDQVDERGGRKDAVGNEVFAKPVEHGADERADDNDRQPHLRIEI